MGWLLFNFYNSSHCSVPGNSSLYYSIYAYTILGQYVFFFFFFLELYNLVAHNDLLERALRLIQFIALDDFGKNCLGVIRELLR